MSVDLDAAVKAASARLPQPPAPPPKTNARASKKPQDEPLPPARTIGEVIGGAGGLGAYLASRSKTGVLSPWINFNMVTGGLHGGELTILAAGTSVGKTDWALNYSLHAASIGKVGVAFFSLEMSEPEITDRLICLPGQIDRSSLKDEDLDPEEFQPWVDAVADIPLYIIDCSSLTLLTLQHSLIELRKQHEIGLVVVDYLQLMSSDRHRENRVQEVTALSRGLKLTAKETKLPLLVLSQLTRSSGREKRPPELYDLRDSGSIEQDANVVVFLFNPDMNKYKEKPAVYAPVEAIIAKNRNGPRGRMAMLFQPSTGRFEQK